MARQSFEMCSLTVTLDGKRLTTYIGDHQADSGINEGLNRQPYACESYLLP